MNVDANIVNALNGASKWYYLVILIVNCIFILKLFDHYFGIPRIKLTEQFSFFAAIFRDGIVLAFLLILGEFCVLKFLGK